MMRVMMTLLAISLASVSLSATAGEVYKWVAADGSNSYSDKPQHESAERLKVHAGAVSTSAATPDGNTQAAAQQQVANAQTADSQGTRADEQTAATESSDEERERRAENCRRARAALDSIMHTNRLYEPMPDGERRYLSAEEVTARKDRAFADVDTWCDGNS